MLRTLLSAAAAQAARPRLASTHLPAVGSHQRRHQMAAAAGSQSEPGTSTKPLARGIVFDMDGTLTKAVIDFADMRRRVAAVGGLDRLEGDILDIIASWPAEQQVAAHAEIAAVEAIALQNMQLMPGVLELSEYLDRLGVPRALVTRNVNSSIEFFHKHTFTLPPFVPALSREFAPYKPNPASLLHIAERWGVSPAQLVMIGDSAKDDIVCGNRAGALTILLDEARQWGGVEELPGEERPTFIARSLHEVKQVLEQQLQLVPPEVPPQPLD